MGKISTFLALTIIIILAVIVGGGILAYQYWWLPKQETPPQESPSIKVFSPNGGETWQAGSVQTIKWTSQNVPQGAHIRLGLYSTSLREGPVIAEDIPVVNNSYSWTVGLALGSGSFDSASDYKLTADVYTGPVCGLYPVMGGNCSATASILTSDSSDAAFSIVAATTCITNIMCVEGYAGFDTGVKDGNGCPILKCAPISTPSITVLSPNGGENWVQGSKQVIRWASSGVRSAQVVIGLLYPGEAPQPGEWVYLGEVASTENTGYFEWNAGEVYFEGGQISLLRGNNYKIEIREDINVDIPIASDKSDAPFSIK